MRGGTMIVAITLAGCAPAGPSPSASIPRSSSEVHVDASTDAPVATTATALDASTDAAPSPNEVACAAFFDKDDSFPRASRNVLAASSGYSLGGGVRFEITSDRIGRVIEFPPPRHCYQVALPPARIEAFRRTLIKNGFCTIGSNTQPHPDEIVHHLEAHLPGVSCAVAFPDSVVYVSEPSSEVWTENLKHPYRDIFEAFERLEREVRSGSNASE